MSKKNDWLGSQIESWLGSPKTEEDLFIQKEKLKILRNSLDNRIDILKKEQNGLKMSIFKFRKVRSQRKEINAEIEKKKKQLSCLKKWIEWDELLYYEVINNGMSIGTPRIRKEGESTAKHAPYPNEQAQVRSALLDLEVGWGADPNISSLLSENAKEEDTPINSAVKKENISANETSASSNSTGRESPQARLLKGFKEQTEKNTNRVKTKIDNLKSHTTGSGEEQKEERPDSKSLG